MLFKLKDSKLDDFGETHKRNEQAIIYGSGEIFHPRACRNNLSGSTTDRNERSSFQKVSLQSPRGVVNWSTGIDPRRLRGLTHGSSWLFLIWPSPASPFTSRSLLGLTPPVVFVSPIPTWGSTFTVACKYTISHLIVEISVPFQNGLTKTFRRGKSAFYFIVEFAAT